MVWNGQKHSLRVVREVLAQGTTDPKAAKNPSGAMNSSEKKGWLSFLKKKRQRFRANQQATHITGAVEFLLNVSNRKTVCFVVSDFFDHDYLQVLQSANRKHDMIAVMVTDPREIELPNVGLVHLTDAETGDSVVVDSSSAAVRARYKESALARIRQTERNFRASKIDFIQVDCSQSIVEPLVRFFKMREQRRRR